MCCAALKAALAAQGTAGSDVATVAAAASAAKQEIAALVAEARLQLEGIVQGAREEAAAIVRPKVGAWGSLAALAQTTFLRVVCYRHALHDARCRADSLPAGAPPALQGLPPAARPVDGIQASRLPPHSIVTTVTRTVRIGPMMTHRQLLQAPAQSHRATATDCAINVTAGCGCDCVGHVDCRPTPGGSIVGPT